MCSHVFRRDEACRFLPAPLPVPNQMTAKLWDASPHALARSRQERERRRIHHIPPDRTNTSFPILKLSALDVHRGNKMRRHSAVATPTISNSCARPPHSFGTRFPSPTNKQLPTSRTWKRAGCSTNNMFTNSRMSLATLAEGSTTQAESACWCLRFGNREKVWQVQWLTPATACPQSSRIKTHRLPYLPHSQAPNHASTCQISAHLVTRSRMQRPPEMATRLDCGEVGHMRTCVWTLYRSNTALRPSSKAASYPRTTTLLNPETNLPPARGRPLLGGTSALGRDPRDPTCCVISRSGSWSTIADILQPRHQAPLGTVTPTYSAEVKWTSQK